MSLEILSHAMIDVRVESFSDVSCGFANPATTNMSMPTSKSKSKHLVRVGHDIVKDDRFVTRARVLVSIITTVDKQISIPKSSCLTSLATWPSVSRQHLSNLF